MISRVGDKDFEMNRNPTKDEIKSITKGFEEVNMVATNNEYNKPEDWITLVIRDNDGNIIGGIQTSTIYWAQYLEVLWVDKKYRRQGYARDLILEAERIARENGCVSSHTYTFKWQGPEFYKAVGYKEVAVFEGYHEGLTEHIFMKKLNEPTPRISISDPDRFVISRDESPETKKIVGTLLGSDFEENAGELLKKYPHQLFAIALKDQDGVVVGGIKGYTIMGTMLIEEFWVDEKHRKQGFGSALLENAKELALERNCISFQSFCMSYNNIEFMMNRGFETYGQTDGYPNNVKEYYLIKRFHD
ncbi:MAG: GNAT family N-acetyltransferase [Candidatus Thorarchaeota archaeon]